LGQRFAVNPFTVVNAPSTAKLAPRVNGIRAPDRQQYPKVYPQTMSRKSLSQGPSR
jgi:hypothetical protein